MSIFSTRSLVHALDYARYFFSAGNEHSVHSPFVFSLLTKGIYDKKNDSAFTKIENIRKSLLADQTIIQVIDLGAGSSFDGHLTARSISEITRKFAKSPNHCRFLFRITQFLQPAQIIELGTSLGISTMYLASGNPKAKVTTLEGCPETSRVARQNFEKHNFASITNIPGNFDDTLEPLLNDLKKFDLAYIDGNHTYEATIRYFSLLKAKANEKSVIVFDDIYWSEGMKKAWAEIKSDPSVTISIDFFQFGVVFFNPGFTKQEFKLQIK